jgi:hypothetical protein
MRRRLVCQALPSGEVLTRSNGLWPRSFQAWHPIMSARPGGRVVESKHWNRDLSTTCLRGDCACRRAEEER